MNLKIHDGIILLIKMKKQNKYLAQLINMVSILICYNNPD